MSRSFLQEAIQAVQQAVQQDSAGQPALAVPLYRKSLDLLHKAKNVETNQATKRMITEKIAEYSMRLSDLSASLPQAPAVPDIPDIPEPPADFGSPPRDEERSVVEKVASKPKPVVVAKPSKPSIARQPSKNITRILKINHQTDGTLLIVVSHDPRTLPMLQQLIQSATEADEQKDYRKALEIYRYVGTQLLHLAKKETKPQRRKLMMNRTTDYTNRAEQLSKLIEASGATPYTGLRILTQAEFKQTPFPSKSQTNQQTKQSPVHMTINSRNNEKITSEIQSRTGNNNNDNNNNNNNVMSPAMKAKMDKTFQNILTVPFIAEALKQQPL